MGNRLSHLPAAASATRTVVQGGRSGGPERIDFLFVVSVVIIITMIYYYGLSSPLACPRAVCSGGSFILQKNNHLMGL